MSASKILLDTSAFTHLRGGDARVADAVAAARLVHLSAVTLGELEAGALIGKRAAENRAALIDFLSAPFVAVLPVTADVSRVYGRVFAALRKARTPIGSNDIWIAATAIDAGAHVLTFDQDFARIAGLDVEVLA